MVQHNSNQSHHGSVEVTANEEERLVDQEGGEVTLQIGWIP